MADAPAKMPSAGPAAEPAPARRPVPGAPRVVVVGGGVTGLSTAWYLRREAERRGAAVEIVVLEREAAAGGKVRTAQVDHPLGQFVVEAGADSFLTQSKPWALDLSVEIGMAHRLIGTNDAARKVFVLNRGRLHPLPEGIFLIVPTRLGPFVRSGLLSPVGKLRTGLDLVLPRRRDEGDETLAEFVTRRLGAQILDRIAEPLLSGIYNADAGRQSVLATLPRLRQLEHDHRSLILAALALRRRGAGGAATHGAGKGGGTPSGSPHGGGPSPGTPCGRAAADTRTSSARSPALPRSLFASYKGGMQELVDRLGAELGDDLRLGVEVAAVAARNDGGHDVTVRAAASLVGEPASAAADYSAGSGGTRAAGSSAGSQATLAADAVVLCTPPTESARLLDEPAPRAAGLLATIRSVSTGILSLAYEGDVLPAAARGFGLVIPTSEQRPINAVTCSSVKFDGRAPSGCTLLRVFFGGSRSPRTFTLGDDEVVALARHELSELLGVAAEPLFWRLDRWPQAQPQYDVGHLDLVSRIEAALPSGIWVAGCAFRGVGIPDCARQGRETALQIADTLL